MLHPGARWANIEKSLNAYIQATLMVGAGLAVLVPGMPAWNAPPVRWVDVAYVPLSTRYPVKWVHHGQGNERELLVNCNCYEQTAARQDNGGQAGLYSLAALVDTVIGAFGAQVAIPIYDFEASGTPTVSVFLWRAVHPQRLPRAGVWEQVNVSVTLAFPEAHT